MDVVRILPELHGRHQLRASAQQVLQAQHQQVGFGRRDGRGLSFHVRGDQALEELGVRFENQGEVVDGAHRGHRLLIDVARLLKLPKPDEVIAQRDPKSANLVSKLPDPTTNDGLDVQGFDVRGMLGDQITEIHPQLVTSLALHGAEILIVDNICQLLSGLVVTPDGPQVSDVDLYVIWLQHEVASEGTESRLLWHFTILDEFHIELPNPRVLCDGQRAQSSI
mmetsp:Transcript_13781/g.30519  ORF Transcript_13781/g.30519 Transcript_13781/m.30519 type:complete len:223 (-) Transcript_13781:451-1119(-)